MKQFIALIIFCTASFAQNTTTVTATQIHGSGIALLASGKLCFTPVDDSGNPQGYRAGGGGQGTVDEKCTAVTNGAIGSWSVDNPDFTSPAHIKYTIRVLDSNANGKEVRRDTAVDMSGNGGTWSYDSFTPSAGTVLGNFVCPTGYVVSGLTASGQLICAAGGTGSGITLLNGLAAATQTFVNDTNVTITSTGSTHTLGFTGTLAKARQNSATVYNDTANTYTAGSKQTVSSSATTAGLNFAGVSSDPSSLVNGDVWMNTTATQLKARLGGVTKPLATTANAVGGSNIAQLNSGTSDVADTGVALSNIPLLNSQNTFSNTNEFAGQVNIDDSSSPTKQFHFDASSIAAGQNRVVKIPDANSVTVVSSSAPANQFANAVSSLGVVGYAQPSFGNLSGSVASTQMPALTGDVTSSAGTVATTLASIVTGATNTKITYDAKGRVTAGAQAQFSDIGGTATSGQLPATTVYTGQANTFGAFLQKFQAGANFRFMDTTDTSKTAGLDLSNIATATNRTINIPDANSTTAQSFTASANNFLTGMSAQGVFAQAQPAFTNLSGSAACGQLPALTGNVTSSGCATTLVNIPNAVTMAGSLIATNIAAPATPSAGTTALYVDSTSKKLCSKDDAGSVNCTGASGGGSPAGVGSELQFRSNSSTFGAVTSSSTDNSTDATSANRNMVAIQQAITLGNDATPQAVHALSVTYLGQTTSAGSGGSVGTQSAGYFTFKPQASAGTFVHNIAMASRIDDSSTGTSNEQLLANFYWDWTTETSFTGAIPLLHGIHQDGGSLGAASAVTFPQVDSYTSVIPSFNGTNVTITNETGFKAQVMPSTNARITNHHAFDAGQCTQLNYWAAVFCGQSVMFQSPVVQTMNLTATASLPMTDTSLIGYNFTGTVPSAAAVTGIGHQILVQANNASVSTVNGLTGIDVKVLQANTGTVTTAIAGKFNCSSGGTITSCFDLQLTAPINGGTYTQFTAVDIPALSGVGTQTNNARAIDQHGASDWNVFAGILKGKRYFSNTGTATATGDIAISGGWGSTATKGSFTGFDQSGEVTITSSGTGQAASPTVTFTFHDGTWTNAPVCHMWMNGGTGTQTQITNTTESATAPVFTFLGTPVASSTYRLAWYCAGV